MKTEVKMMMMMIMMMMMMMMMVVVMMMMMMMVWMVRSMLMVTGRIMSLQNQKEKNNKI